MATSTGGYTPGATTATTVDNTTMPELDPTLANEIIPQPAAAPATAVTSNTVLDALAKHLGIQQKVGQNLEDLVIAKLQQLPHAGNAPGKGAGGGSAGGSVLGWLGHAIQGVPATLGQSANALGQIPGQIPGEVASPSSGINQFDISNIQGLVGGVETGAKDVNKAVTKVEGAYDKGITGQNAFDKGKGKGKGKGLGQDNIPGSAAHATQPAADTTNNVSQSKAAVIAEIAHNLGAHGNDLNAIASKLKVPVGGDPLSTGTGTNDNGQTVYASFWTKISSDPTYKAQWVGALEKANLLDASQNNGTPDNATVASAFQNLMKASVAYKTPVTALVSAADNNPQQNSSGQDIQGTTSELEAFVQGEAEKLGVDMTPMQITAVSNKYKGDATTNSTAGIVDELKNDIVQYYNPNDPNNPPGAASDMYIQIQAAAAKYGMPADPNMIKSMVVNAITNSAGDSYSIAAAAKDAASAAEQHFQTLAAGAYPALAGQIMSGQDVATLITPYNNITAQYTGKDPASLSNPGVDPTSADYAFLQGAKDPKTGQPTMMTMNEWKQKLMQDPQYGFQNTAGGKALASQMASSILNAFGKVNTESSPGQFSGFSGGLSSTAGTYNA